MSNEPEPGYWPTELPPEALAYADAYIETHAHIYDDILPGLGDAGDRLFGTK